MDSVVEGKAECPFELPGGEFVDLEFESLIVGVGDSFHIVVFVYTTNTILLLQILR